ncbi:MULTISPECIES: efflux RND transporter periplasmic adaptor subunit [Paraburkholderia]|uniref:Membrane fusion protein, multidrug efflux system n=2 Tax=Paraburkholderia TaxID=1822464 RepID=A0A7Z7BCR0_9BURK|nr:MULTISPECIES: efflux RND transporter periplasmic adaptor subunit [Paraburkholderia]AUT66024.1 efflux RND transporter periplasmic adaptor subunit [Paraburkholderia terrae]BDC43068.1 multidrug resistance protein [Paraburkholderia terrae]SDI76006.1 membrane fusion protein, multidrug efflux system [Paraburkholderia steynii]
MKSRLERVSLLCLCLIVLAACSKKAPPPPPPQVSTVKVQAQSVPLERRFVGRLSPYYSANVTARVSGVLLKRNYAEGSQVRAGQLLFEIDPTFYRAQLDNDLAILAQDRATYINDHITAERNRKLLPVGSISQQTVDNSDAAERSAAAKVKADEATVQSARISLDYTRVTAPISGIAGQQQVTAGAVVGSSTTDSGGNGTLLTTIQQIDPMYVNFTISSADLATLQQSQTGGTVDLSQQNQVSVRIALPNGAAYGSAGTLDFSDVTVNASTGAVNLRALVANPQRRLLPGMFVSLTVDFGRQNDVFLVPQQALLRDTTGGYMLLVGGDGKVARRDVETVNSLGNNWIVTHGLKDGDEVIVTGVQFAHEGAPVKTVAWQPPAAASPGSSGAAASSPGAAASSAAAASAGMAK